MVYFRRLPSSLLIAGLLAALSQPALASRVNVDFDGDAFATTGEIFESIRPGTGSGTIPFQLNFGSGAATYDYCFAADGFVSFIASGGTCGSGSTPTGDYIAPFLANLTVGGNTLSAAVLVDSTAPFTVADATPGIHFIWDGTDGSGNAVLADLLLLDRGAGNFDFVYDYGNDLLGINGAPATGKQGFSLGANVSPLVSGPFATSTSYLVSFRGGTAVPEPTTFALLAAGLLALPFLRRRRHSASRATGERRP